MSTNLTVKNIESKDLDSIARFYNLPAPVAKMMFAVIGDSLYPKLQFLLYQAHKRGVQRIELSQPKEVNGEWTTEARVYPYLAPTTLNKILELPADERKAIWEHYSKPTIEWGRASKENVANPTMHKWLPEMSRKRAAARALRLFAGIGQTAYEELPEVMLSREELETDGIGNNVITMASSAGAPVTEAKQDPDLCCCGHSRSVHLSDGTSLYCTACIKAGNELKCDIQPTKR